MFTYANLLLAMFKLFYSQGFSKTEHKNSKINYSWTNSQEFSFFQVNNCVLYNNMVLIKYFSMETYSVNQKKLNLQIFTSK